MRSVVIPVVCLAFVLALGSSAAADPWGDAKKDFKRDQRSKEWKTRRYAYDGLAIFDGAEAVDLAIKAMAKEKTDAVILGAIKAIGGFVTEEAQDAVAAAMLKARGDQKLYLIMAMGMQPGERGKDALLTVIEDQKNLPAAAQALMALGRKSVRGALPVITPFLSHREWQMRSAAAQAIKFLPGPEPSPPTDPKAKPKPWVPEWFDADAAVKAIVEALPNADGVERGHMIEALHRATKQAFGYDLPAWKQYVSGTDPTKIRRKPKHPPYFFGIPVWGKRVVFITTMNQRVDQPHPYQKQERLREICHYPNGRDLVYIRIQTIRQVHHHWIQRTVEELDKAEGAKFEFLCMGTKVEPAFGKLIGASASSRGKLDKLLEKLPIEAGNDIHTAFMMALDISGKSDGAAWSKGPDQILHSNSAPPWLAEITDPEEIAGAVALKAARRMVTIHNVGVEEHAYELMETISGQTGGVYLSLER